MSQVDPNRKTLLSIFLVNLTKDNDVVRRVVLDFKTLKIEEYQPKNYPDDLISAVVTIDDDDFFAVSTKQTNMRNLINEVG
jgi:hypothetical protein